MPAHQQSFPHLRISGDPHQRGVAYGRGARTLIAEAMSAYAEVFQHYQDWTWAEVQRRAKHFEPVIADFSPRIIEEMSGIAEGAGVELNDIIALNTRSEMMFASGVSDIGECTSFCLDPTNTQPGTLLSGQNWDWILAARRTSVVLEVHRDDAPDFITVVEAGLLAKVGMNSAGVGLCTNTLISDHHEGQPGVPYHVLLRATLDSTSAAEAQATIAEADRAISANYLVSDTSGYAVDLETTPEPGGVHAASPTNGVLTHANHFLNAGLTGEDRYVARKAHTLDRLRAIDLLMRGTEAPHSVESLKTALGDHTFHPSSICQHPDLGLPRPEQTCTVAGVVVDLANSDLHVAAGNPCTAPWRHYHLG